MRSHLLLIMLVLASTRNAAAAVVLECHLGARPDDTSQVLAPLLDELEALGVAARPQTVRAKIVNHTSQPGILNPAITITALSSRVDAGQKLLRAGNHKAAKQAFESALADAYDNVAMMVDNRARSQKVMMDLLVGLATSRHRLKDYAGAERAFQELVRSFPDQDLAIRNGYGTEPSQRYQMAHQQLDRQGRGTLLVTVNDPGALIFINEMDRPQNATFEADVLPGLYRVLVQMPGAPGRLYPVVVEPNKKVQIQIDAAFDAAVTVIDTWVGFTFPTMDAARHHLPEYARRLITSDDTALIALSRTSWDHQPAIVGSVYRLDTGARLRSHLVVLGAGDNRIQLQWLARVLYSGEASARPASESGVIAVADPLAPQPAVVAPRAARRAPSRAKWWLAGAAVVTAAGAGALVYVDNSDTCNEHVPKQCKYLVYTANYGYASLAAAGLMAVGTAYLFHRDGRSSRTRVGVTSASSGALVTVAGSF